MERKIEHPKVFISYSWSSKEYEEKVMNLAVRLQGDGIEVIIDKWDMKPGNDTVSFMEKSVKDPNINFVLMLLDKKYTEKANIRSGGVGIETQIISSEVYNNVEQSKFIPIVFERMDNGEIFIPIYLKSRFYYDLTQGDSNEQYVKLVKHIYGREIYYKPNLGNKPNWVDENINSPNVLKLNIMQKKGNIEKLVALSDEMKKSDLYNGIDDSDDTNEFNLKLYQKSLMYRNTLIEIFLSTYSEENFIDAVCDFYEDIKNWNRNNEGIIKEIWDAFIHETFVYLIAVLLKFKQYKTINIFITKSYFQNGYTENIVSVNYFFYSYNYDIISKSKCEIDDKKYYNGMATLWIENIYEPKLTKEDITLADLLIYNLTILLLNGQDWYWFPITYIYAGNFEFNSVLKGFSIRLKSKYEIRKMNDLFGIKDEEELKKLFEPMKKFGEDKKEKYRYSSAFEYADLITDYIKIEEIGMLN